MYYIFRFRREKPCFSPLTLPFLFLSGAEAPQRHLTAFFSVFLGINTKIPQQHVLHGIFFPSLYGLNELPFYTTKLGKNVNIKELGN